MQVAGQGTAGEQRGWQAESLAGLGRLPQEEKVAGVGHSFPWRLSGKEELAEALQVDPEGAAAFPGTCRGGKQRDTDLEAEI